MTGAAALLALGLALVPRRLIPGRMVDTLVPAEPWRLAGLIAVLSLLHDYSFIVAFYLDRPITPLPGPSELLATRAPAEPRYGFVDNDDQDGWRSRGWSRSRRPGSARGASSWSGSSPGPGSSEGGRSPHLRRNQRKPLARRRLSGRRRSHTVARRPAAPPSPRSP